MAASAKLHLTFEPPASEEKLARFKTLMGAQDWDAPTENIGVKGVKAGHLVRKIDGDLATYWRSPLISTEALAALLTGCGITGSGWCYDDDYGERCDAPRPSEHFTFGEVPPAVTDILTLVESLTLLERMVLDALMDGVV